MKLRANKEELSMAPSVAILQGLEDMRECVKDPRYEIDMDVYHRPKWTRNPRRFAGCTVCLAGSSMAKRYETSPRKTLHPLDMSRRTYKILEALDCFRIGDVHEGLKWLGIEPPLAVPEQYNVVQYRRSKIGFHRDMKMLAAMLKRHGL